MKGDDKKRRVVCFYKPLKDRKCLKSIVFYSFIYHFILDNSGFFSDSPPLIPPL
jgi:hypothetical protein